ncbi:ZIP family metal transporter [Candidatus Halobonum tyrrellensis]|uniref:Zinc/iron permease n=1 Tax=Candidatus Halobonum tyrrellensis G22 TaxID=1324957 RepID=V4HHA1_9EURY|nr:ZIP family metal transporter [Candidatus Halobonum tyrrellensis]ESP90135.1 zinc/iron permease [Candidatus Halobonum tyrrellensis G22]
MALLESLAFVFVAGLITALATGIGALPFFLVDDVSDRWNVALWGLASGIMVAASGFGLIDEGMAEAGGLTVKLLLGLLAGVVLVVVADEVLSYVNVSDHADTEPATDGGHPHAHEEDHDHHVDPQALAEGNLKKMVLILGILTVHSFPEGVAVGVSFAELGLEGAGGVSILGFAVPVLAVFMTLAISIHNIPEGLAISIPLRSLDVSEWRMVGLAVFSSLPQPIGAVIAFYFVRVAREWLPFGFGFAAGAMVFLVLTEFIPEALESGVDLRWNGYPELAAGVSVGVAVMVPLAMI